MPAKYTRRSRAPKAPGSSTSYSRTTSFARPVKATKTVAKRTTVPRRGGKK